MNKYYSIWHPTKGNLCIQGIYGSFSNALAKIETARLIHGKDSYIKCTVDIICKDDKDPFQTSNQAVSDEEIKDLLSKYRSGGE